MIFSLSIKKTYPQLFPGYAAVGRGFFLLLSFHESASDIQSNGACCPKGSLLTVKRPHPAVSALVVPFFFFLSTWGDFWAQVQSHSQCLLEHFDRNALHVLWYIMLQMRWCCILYRCYPFAGEFSLLNSTKKDGYIFLPLWEQSRCGVA